MGKDLGKGFNTIRPNEGAVLLLEETGSDVTKMVIIGLVIGLVIGGVIGYLYSSITKKDSMAIPSLTNDEVSIKTAAFINQNLISPGMTAEVEGVKEVAGAYEVQVAIDSGVEVDRALVYVSSDGSLLFIGPPINMTEPIQRPATTQAPLAETNINMQALIDDDPSAGNVNAKVIVVEFSDFQCPFCAKALPTVSQIKETYGDKILFVYRDFPLHDIHPEAGKAAEAAQCAFEQGLFWEYHDNIFEKQGEWVGVGVPKFKEYAGALGLNVESFNECLDSGKYADEVEADLLEGQHFGVTGTPSFFINGRKITGAQPFSVFQDIIDEELVKTG
jgi:protein-disulfide isomerase